MKEERSSEAEPVAARVVRSDGSRGSLTALPTSEMRLAPALVQALEGIAPKAQRSRVPYVIGAAIAVVLATLASSSSVREYVIGVAREGTASSPVIPSSTPDVSVTNVSVPAVTRAADAPAASAPAPTGEPAETPTPPAASVSAKPAAKKTRRH